MKKLLLTIASVAEAVTGVILLVSPSLVTHVLFGAEVSGAGAIMSRIAGISLIALGVACWPDNAPNRAVYGMFAYSTLAMLCLIDVGLTHEYNGILLWPAVVVHAGLSVLLAAEWVLHRKVLAPGEKTTSSNQL